MTTLAALVTLLQAEVPASNSVPTEAQYTQAIKDAILDFSRRCGLEKIAELDIVSGTPTYSFSADFLKLIWLEALTGHDGVIISDGGIIPISADWEETYQIINKQITFFPTPTYTLSREYKYKSGWVATAGDYTTLGEDEAQIILLKAKAICLQKQANAESSGMKYSFGAVSVDKGSTVDTKTKDSNGMEREYLDACESYNAPVLGIS